MRREINPNLDKFKVICVFPLTDQVELRELETNQRIYYKAKYANDPYRSLKPGDVVRFDGRYLQQVKRGKK